MGELASSSESAMLDVSLLPNLMRLRTSGSWTTWQNSSRPRKDTTREGSRSGRWRWICDHGNTPVCVGVRQCSGRLSGAKMRPLILLSSVSISRTIQLFSGVSLFRRKSIFIRVLSSSARSQRRSGCMGMGYFSNVLTFWMMSSIVQASCLSNSFVKKTLRTWQQESILSWTRRPPQLFLRHWRSSLCLFGSLFKCIREREFWKWNCKKCSR